jgi:hypothetical protein
LPREAGAGGNLPASGGFCTLTGGILSSVKQPEFSANRAGSAAGSGKKLIFRVFEVEGKETTTEISLACAAASAWLTDATEEKHLGDCAVSGDGKTVSFKLPPYSVRAVVIELKYQ